MKRLFLSLIAALLIFGGCNNSNQFKVTMNLGNADDQTVYLCKDVDGKLVEVANAVVAGGKAVMVADNDDPQLVYAIRLDPRDANNTFRFFTENQNVVIDGDLDDMEHWTAKGNANVNLFNDFRQEDVAKYEDPINQLQEEMFAAYEAGDTTMVNELFAQASELIEAYDAHHQDFIRSHSDSYLAHFVLNEIKGELDFDQVKELYDGFTGESVYSRRIKAFIDERAKVEVGASFLDFTLKTAGGEEVNLASVIGANRLVLVDFWASWCGPCRGENPYVKAAYEKYHAQGFEIIGVSVDQDEAAWLKAVADDGMTWIQVRDVDNAAAIDYMVQYIPSNFLFDSHGVMVAKGLRGEALEAKLAELLQ